MCDSTKKSTIDLPTPFVVALILTWQFILLLYVGKYVSKYYSLKNLTAKSERHQQQQRIRTKIQLKFLSERIFSLWPSNSAAREREKLRKLIKYRTVWFVRRRMNRLKLTVWIWLMQRPAAAHM